ncbi:4'-phosphopantetheinyl transferase superfamily [Parasitella parasitica]|nr:4'-phosphopantetheinyl transferase superfamily [Parasitella parasitica]
MDKPDLLCFNIKGAFEGDKFDRALSWLPTVEHPSVMRFKFDKDRHLALANLLLRRHYFSQKLQMPWFDLEFDRLPAGKPILKRFESLHYDFNTSHEGDWVIFGCTKNMKIGVDTVVIDRPKNQSIDAYLEIFRPQLTPREMHLVMDSNDNDVRLETFYQLWGCKESYTKAVGFGLSLDLQTLEFSNEEDKIKMKLDGKLLDNWAYYMCRLDSITLAVICFGFIEMSSKLDQSLVEFSQSTQLLGKPLQVNNNNSSIFHQIRFEDIENNKWMPR